MNFPIKVLVFVLSLVISQQVILCDVIIYDELKELYNNDIWKRSIAYDAPVIDPNETLKLLKQLASILPKNKNVYLDDEERWREPQIVGSTDEDWHKNEVFGIIDREVKDLIEYSDINKVNCFADNFKFKYYIEDGSRSSTSPERNIGYGPNIKAYLLKSRLDLLKECTKIVEEFDREELNSNELSSIEQMTNYIFPNGFSGSPNDFLNINEKSDIIVNGIAEYLKNESHDKNEFKVKFDQLDRYCQRYRANHQKYGFIQYCLNKHELASIMLKDPTMSKLSYQLMACYNMSVDKNLKQVLTAAGYRSDIKGILKNILS